MARINLLPWRETERQRRQREFLAILAGSLVLAAAISAFAHLQVEAMIDYQNQRNTFLDGEIAQLNRRIKEIHNLEKTKANLIARMSVIQQLQESRPEIVHLFDELVSTLPDGVYLTKITQRGRDIELQGRAQSNARVSAYMRNIDASPWMGGANLKVIQQRDAKRSDLNEFVLTAKQIDKRKRKKK
jgi:type IV pilus assembly protein PilN